MVLLNRIRKLRSRETGFVQRDQSADWPAVFVSYRRDDARDEVERIHAKYCELYRDESIFWDLRDIRAGAQFPPLLRDRVRNAVVVLVVIGPGWSSSRLRHRNDWVRQEVRIALKSQCLVVPLLVNGARMPTRNELPSDIKALADRNYLVLSSTNFDADVGILLHEIGPRLADRSQLNAWEEISLFATSAGAAAFKAVETNIIAPERLALYGDKAGWYDPRINTFLLKKSLNYNPLRYRQHPQCWLAYNTSADEARKRYAIERKLVAGAAIRNDQKIRLASDMGNPISEPIIVQQTDYVSSLMTDQLAFYQVRRGEDLLFHETDGFLNQETGALLPLSRTQMSNQIGVSILAFSSDGYLLFVQQTSTNSQSGGTLAPSGSGSLDWADIETIGGDDLLEVLRYGGARELIEECGLDNHLCPSKVASDNVHIYAFARMLHRGGKPEFFGVAHLPFTAAEVHALSPSQHERAFSKHSESARTESIDPHGDLRAEIIRICSTFSKAGHRPLNEQALKLSYPLHHGLDLLHEAISAETEAARRLSDFLAEGLQT